MDERRNEIRSNLESFIQMKNIPFASPDLTGNEERYVLEALRSGWLTHHGTFEQKFESAFSEYVGKPSLATSSGTGALHLALLTLGIGKGDEVIVPNLTFAATATTVLAVGATPILVDVDGRGCLEREKIFIGPRTKAIMPVHLYGEDAGDFSEFGVPVIEDSCEALGMVPIRGDLACFSFYANKTITTGEGGMLCGKLANAEQWRNGGFNSDYYHEIPGLNYRMTNLQAAVGLAQLERIDELLSKRLRNASIYASEFQGFGKWLFVIKTEEPKILASFLKEKCIDSRPVFHPLNRMPPFLRPGYFKNSENIWQTGLCLPTGPHLSDEDLERIIETIHEYQHIQRTENRRRQLG